MEDNLHAIHCSANQRKQGLISEGVLCRKRPSLLVRGTLAARLKKDRDTLTAPFSWEAIFTSCFAVWCQVPLVA
jgi:hypothetical protein